MMIIPVSAPGHCPEYTVFYVPERQGHSQLTWVSHALMVV